MKLPVIDLNIAISDWIILKPHQMQVQHWRELDEDHTLLCLLYSLPCDMAMDHCGLTCRPNFSASYLFSPSNISTAT